MEYLSDVYDILVYSRVVCVLHGVYRLDIVACYGMVNELYVGYTV